MISLLKRPGPNALDYLGNAFLEERTERIDCCDVNSFDENENITNQSVGTLCSFSLLHLHLVAGEQTELNDGNRRGVSLFGVSSRFARNEINRLCASLLQELPEENAHVDSPKNGVVFPPFVPFFSFEVKSIDRLFDQ